MPQYYIKISGENQEEAKKNLLVYLAETKCEEPFYEIEKNHRLLLINDDLRGLAENACYEARERLEELWQENKECEAARVVEVFRDQGIDHEIADNSVPVYTWDINCLWFSHANELEEAYENAGIGENPRENNGMTAIYCYINEAINEYVNDWERENENQVTCDHCGKHYDYSEEAKEVKEGGNHICAECWSKPE